MSIYVAYGGTRETPKIGLLEVDAHISEDHQWSNQVPVHPVESGLSVNDAIIRNPMTLTLDSTVSVAPIYPDRVSDKSLNRADNAYNRLVRLVTQATVVSVITGVKRYRNMAITELSIPRSSEDGLSLNFTISLQEIRIAKSVSVINQDDPQATTLGVRTDDKPLELYASTTSTTEQLNVQQFITVPDGTFVNNPPAVADFANQVDLRRIEEKQPK